MASRMGGAPIMVMNQQVQRETGRKAQLSNIAAGKAVSDIVRTTMGPRSMLKMLLDPMGGIVMTNDGNSILREVDVSHPAAKSMIELSRAQDEQVGDGTTSVIVLAGEYLARAEPLLDRKVHPTVICNGYLKALDDALKALDAVAVPLDLTDRAELTKIVMACTGTKFISRFSEIMVDLALQVRATRPPAPALPPAARRRPRPRPPPRRWTAVDPRPRPPRPQAVQTVVIEDDGRKEIDIKRYAKAAIGSRPKPHTSRPASPLSAGTPRSRRSRAATSRTRACSRASCSTRTSSTARCAAASRSRASSSSTAPSSTRRASPR